MTDVLTLIWIAVGTANILLGLCFGLTNNTWLGVGYLACGLCELVFNDDES